MGLVGIIALSAVSCKKNLESADNKSLQATPYGGLGPVTLSGAITANRTLSQDTTYLIDGKVFVAGGATLTIQPGTLLKGVSKASALDASALVVTRGAKIDAQGTADAPIIFTSNEAAPAPGDWGGVVLLGKAPINKPDTLIEGIDNNIHLPGNLTLDSVRYGGNVANDNSGILKYVRIEYAGASIAANNELNSLTCGGVGNGTTLSYIEAYYGRDDSFEWFGGTVNADHLVAVASDDDAFDTDFGFSGSISYAVSVLDPNKPSYSSNPNGLEADNDGTGSTATPYSFPKYDHLTIVGVENSTIATAKALFNGAHFRRRTKLQVTNSIFIGFPTGIRFESDTTGANAVNFKNNLVQGFTADYILPTGYSVGTGNTSFVGNTSNANTNIELISPFDAASFVPVIGSNADSNPYKGAFDPYADQDWTFGWTNFAFIY
ncbi:hypothetical protein SAMN05421788_108196 [Filimonas lacunae]|uniref:T9SS C-terminal target domain-containing protein n=2 Tax=Filimonas lacunae TaxID=477680 RepID=A0A1N7R1W7_9BACT|nr:hypothetical protein SAMN05421788_108196 [Filimonas lacunae]